MNILLTGATSGIGWETFKSLWKDGNNMILPVRNMKKALGLLAGYGANERVYLVQMNLADLKSVNEATKEISTKYQSIDIIINNAGGMFPPKKKTVEGLDESFVVNHLGHFLLTKRLLHLLPKDLGKVISVSSKVHQIGKVNPSDIGLNKSTSSFASYATVKLYNILFTKLLRKKYSEQNLQVYALHPGAVNTSFGNSSGSIEKAIIGFSKLFFISPKKGVETTLYLANTPSSKLTNGGYYQRKKLASVSNKANDLNLAEKLWQFSETELKRILG